jgi:pimeloyl-ACP methyl ester carboxylesterase
MIRGGVKRSVWLIIPAVMIMLAWSTAVPAVASPSATDSGSEPCPGISLQLHLGTTTPVLLVHGFNEGPGVFTSGSPSLESAITKAVGSAVTLVTFDYSNWSQLWVTFDRIGPQLARCITWLAHTSMAHGGPGKVVIVAHSMGGLAVRCAVDPTCAKGIQAANKNLIGLVITLGTPNLGSNPQTLGTVGDFICTLISQCNDLLILRDSPAAQAMVPGSPELAKLPLLPASIPVDAIAGSIGETTSLFGHTYVIGNAGDFIVPVASALADAQQAALHAGPGANNTTVNCGTIPVNDKSWYSQSLSLKALAPPVTCWHLTETTDARWQADIIAAIKAYLAARLVTVNIPVVSCPTRLGIDSPAVPLPSSRPVAVPQVLAADLSLYADNQGVMELLGPKGWSCTAEVGADGSAEVMVYPPGAGPSSPVAIAGGETSACVGCTLYQACSLFPSAAKALRSDFGQACPTRPPASETVMSIAAGIVAFEDPPGVKGDGQPSGGQYPADGVMTYPPSAQDYGSWQETCTLPASEKDVCTAVLNTFVSWYGQR